MVVLPKWVWADEHVRALATDVDDTRDPSQATRTRVDLARRVADLGDERSAISLWGEAEAGLAQGRGPGMFRLRSARPALASVTPATHEPLVTCQLGRADAEAQADPDQATARRSLSHALATMASGGATSRQRRHADALDAWITGQAGDLWGPAGVLRRLAAEAHDAGDSDDSLEWAARSAQLSSLLGDGSQLGAMKAAVHGYEERGLLVRSIRWACELSRALASQREVEGAEATLMRVEGLRGALPVQVVAGELAGAWSFVGLAQLLAGDSGAAAAAERRAASHVDEIEGWSITPAFVPAIYLMLAATFYPTATGVDRQRLAFGWGAWLPDVRSVGDDLLGYATERLEVVAATHRLPQVTRQWRGRLAAAQLDFQAAVVLFEDAVTAQRRLDVRYLALPMHDLGVAQRLVGDVVAAASTLRRAVAADRAHPEFASDSGGTVHELAAALGLIGQHADALTSYRVARELHAARRQDSAVRDCDRNISLLVAGHLGDGGGLFRSGFFDQVWLTTAG